MAKEDSSIHDFDFDLIVDYFSMIDRQGPGSPEVTKKALEFIDNLDNNSQIADIGCGTGGQTRVLARNAPGFITGIDLFPKFVDIFNQKVKKEGLEDRVKAIVGDMEKLAFQEEELDLLWAEGSIYNIGFKEGMSEWKRFIKKGGHIAVTEACWFTLERPEEIDKFWKLNYPGIDTIGNKILQMEETGYVPIASFILPENCWQEHFYLPQIDARKKFLGKHAGNKVAEDFIENQRHEEKLYNKYNDFYGYVFFIGKKV